ncbi:hypothetical protein F5Y06DRAFT_286714 [Hypoxylon sp. FL0890]|nr:hypothetical protein F5Y06DRAFT_286714 [Hypoxylon sp. FL0890]
MAEALGVAANCIAITQISSQVGGAVFKLKQLWREVKDVPADIADLMEQIDCLGPVLWETEVSFSQSGPPEIVWNELASKSTTMYCRKALQNLTGIVDELSLQINTTKRGRRKIAAVKQSYLVALTRVQPDITVERFTALIPRDNQPRLRIMPEPESKPQEETISSSVSRWPDKSDVVTQPRWQKQFLRLSLFGRILVGRSASSYTILLQAPMWLSRRSWELHCIRACGAWQLNLRCYLFVPYYSKAMGLARSRRGSPRDMQKLFDAGLASPYDRCEFGRTLLHEAAFGQNLEMIKYLTSVGLSPSDPDDKQVQVQYAIPSKLIANLSTRYPAQLLTFRYKTSHDPIKEVLSDLTFSKSFLVYSDLNYLEYEEAVQPSICHCRSSIHDLEIFEALLPYQSLRDLTSQLAVLKLILEPEWSTNPQSIFRSETFSLLGAVASRLCQSLQWKTTKRGRFLLPKAKDCWFTFAVEDIAVRSFPYKNQHSFTMGLTLMLRIWLAALKHADIDLDAYGRREHEIIVNRTFRHCFFGIKFGPEPEDWEVYWEDPVDAFAGDFWKLIDDPPLQVPGSWVE